MSMTSRFSALLVASTLLSPVMSSAQAAEITQSKADELVQTLTKYLPKDATDTGFVKVTPATNRYELIVDFQALLDHYKPKDFSIAGLKPFVHYLTPQDDGLWRIEANQSLDVTGSAGTGDMKTDYNYKLNDMMLDGIFDPAISYLSSSKWTVQSGSLDTKVKADTTSASFGLLEQTTTTTKISDTHVDLAGKGSLSDWKQSMTSAETGPLSFTAGKIGFDLQMKNFGIVPFRDLIVFALDHIGADKLDAAGAEQLRTILKANLPLTDKFSEIIKISDLQIEAEGMKGSVAEIGYGLDFGGFKRDSTIGFSFSAKKPVLPAGLLPEGTDEALPDDTNLNVTVTDLNLGDAATYFLDHADLSADEPLTPAESEEIGKIVSPDGKIHLAFNNTYARSAHYDFEITGTMDGDMGASDKYNADVTIYAKNLDETIAYLQKNSEVVPVFGQASFGVQMMKGFAKQEADGRYSWNIVVDESGKMKVNGQDFPGQ